MLHWTSRSNSTLTSTKHTKLIVQLLPSDVPVPTTQSNGHNSCFFTRKENCPTVFLDGTVDIAVRYFQPTGE